MHVGQHARTDRQVTAVTAAPPPWSIGDVVEARGTIVCYV
jgi:hypothetical protein